jgi:hypothetical protein
MITDNRCITSGELAEATKLSKRSVLRIIRKKLKMKKVSCINIRIPRALIEQQKQLRKNLSKLHLNRFRREGNSFLNKIITCDETWVHYYDPPRKRQTSRWKKNDEKTPKKPRIMK